MHRLLERQLLLMQAQQLHLLRQRFHLPQLLTQQHQALVDLLVLAHLRLLLFQV
jgi:hypothetical protein